MSTISVLPDTTITTLVTVPTAASSTSSNNGSGVSPKNAKLIGGLVGSIGGTIVIGALVVLFLVLKRKRSNVTNQLPDFANDSRELLDKGPVEKGPSGGFRKIFGSKVSASGGVNQLDLEKDYSAVALDDDFAYRGVSNSNNLDSVFRSSAATSAPISGPGSSSASRPHSRYNSTGNALYLMKEDDPVVLEMDELQGDTTLPDFSGLLHESEDEFLFRPEPHTVWVNENTSNASRLRFAEEL